MNEPISSGVFGPNTRLNRGFTVNRAYRSSCDLIVLAFSARGRLTFARTNWVGCMALLGGDKKTMSSASTDASWHKKRALRYILDAWEEGLQDGLESDAIANAALFAALADLVSSYGEDAVSKMTDELSNRIDRGEFTLNRTLQ